MAIARTTDGTMKRLLDNVPLTLLARLVVGIVFIVASLDKIADPEAFASSILNYKIVSPTLAMVAATVLPWVELLCGLGLLFGIWLRGSALLAGGMLLVFTVAVSSALMRGLDISCGCFTQDPAAGKVGWTKIAEDTLLLGASIFIFFTRVTRFSMQHRPPA